MARISGIVVLTLLVACGGSKITTRENEPAGPMTIKRGEALLEKGDFSGALSVFEAVVEEEPQNAMGHYYIGVAQNNLGNPDAAESHYRLAIGYDANLKAAHNNLGLLLLEKGDLTHAEAALNTYLKLSPDDPSAHFNYALVLESMEKPGQARAHYEKATELDPEDPGPWQGLGDLDRQDGDLKAALASYQKGRKAAPHSPALALREGQTLLELTRLEEAISVFESLTPLPESSAEILTTAGMLLAKYEENDRAVEFYGAALEKDEAYGMAHLLIANALARKKQFAKAAHHYERFLEIAPDSKAAGTAQERLNACKAQMK
ncbi:MAG: tetratricopeptide repeat protein [Myxococcota bacterium]|nr:tetratricopeptide repeat protein [Myxococcota bacterium]